MKKPRAPSDIAREAFMRLVDRHLAPTPTNYQSCYNEIAGLPNYSPFPEAPLRELAGDLVAHNQTQEEALDALSAAIGQRSWQGVREALALFAGAGAPVDGALSGELAQGLARFVESVLPALGDEDGRVIALAGELGATLSQPAPPAAAVQGGIARLAQQVSQAAEEQVEIKGALLKLLHLIVKNIGELSIDDSWLRGQIDGLLASIAPPLDLRHLDEMERRLRDVIEKQARAKARTIEAQVEMRQMLGEFVGRLAAMSASSTAFEGQLISSAERVEQVEHIDELRPLLSEMVSAAHAMADDAASSRNQLKALQDKVAATEAELIQLHKELDNASALARHDPLTDALNRKGLDEVLVREIASMRRKATALSLSLLDIDNFKKLNDSFGHEAGDGALVHLANVVRANLRPSDTLARYGGEEFVILMPDTSVEQGVEAMTRLQRELTKAIYLTGSERILITFSAGVTQLAPDEESGTDALRRADQAMYLAKRAGKNRVMSA
jgi:diguanylate cyclase